MYSGFTHYKYYGAYFYNREAERFNFLKVPEILVDREEFRGLSAEAIILYSILLKRTGM
ncbi:TPA: replication initiator protein A, partial [Streptococcus pneumoniae]